MSNSRNVSLNKKEVLCLRSSYSQEFEFFPEPEISLDFEEEQVESSKPLKSSVEADDSRTQEHFTYARLFDFKFKAIPLCGFPIT